MTDKLVVEMHRSNIYLALTVLIYLFNLFASWHYFYAVWLSFIIDILLSIWLYYFLPKAVLLTKADSIVKIVLDEGYILIEKNNGTRQQYPAFYPAYQSRFLVIINAGKERVVIFKDATKLQSLSQLNKILNTQH